MISPTCSACINAPASAGGIAPRPPIIGPMHSNVPVPAIIAAPIAIAPITIAPITIAVIAAIKCRANHIGIRICRISINRRSHDNRSRRNHNRSRVPKSDTDSNGNVAPGQQ